MISLVFSGYQRNFYCDRWAQNRLIPEKSLTEYLEHFFVIEEIANKIFRREFR